MSMENLIINLLFKNSEKLFVDEVTPTCERCNSVVKPDIVFFGENLPEKFYRNVQKDFKECDLLIVMGTSLTVQPFASLVNKFV
jgi:NAD-dependent deacetylase sirtuin 2